MPRGGRRPGAGAPKGNWNALSSGRRSARLRALILSLKHDRHFLMVYALLRLAAVRQRRKAPQNGQSKNAPTPRAKVA